MTRTLFSLSVLLLFTVACKRELTTAARTYEIDKSAIIWGDEFTRDGALDDSKWGFDVGGSGWGNNESQFYTNRPKNVRVENGHLLIDALLEKYEGRKYTSARVVSKGKGDITYGRVEFRAKLPTGTGTWPALWMLASQSTYGNQYWPDNGEIDVMEHVGFDQDVVHGNVHTKAFNHGIGTNKGDKLTVEGGTAAGFHVYAVNWLPDRIDFEIDGKNYFSFTKQADYGWEQWPFDQPFHVLMNIAVGGRWGGQKGIDDTSFPHRMTIDYVRVYGIKEK